MTCADWAQKIHANFVADVKPTFSTPLVSSGPSELYHLNFRFRTQSGLFLNIFPSFGASQIVRWRTFSSHAHRSLHFSVAG
jgi:hypothetical protein